MRVAVRSPETGRERAAGQSAKARAHGTRMLQLDQALALTAMFSPRARHGGETA